MQIVLMRPEHVEQLREIYLAQVARAPHCCLVPHSRRFGDDLLGLRPQPTRLYPAPQQSLVLVAEASRAALGFATLATYHDEDHEGEERQAITGLFFTDESAGDALVQACEAHATCTELSAFPNTHGNTLIQAYNAGWDGLSDHIPDVARVLTQRGYVPYFRELHLTKPIQQGQGGSRSLSSTITINVPEPPTGYRGAMLAQALDGDSVVGVCSYSTLELLSDDAAARRTGYILWLHVEETHRRRGIAHALMAAAIEKLMMQGCTTCWLTTAMDNWAAQSLYFALGFDVVDCSVSFRKRL